MDEIKRFVNLNKDVTTWNELLWARDEIETEIH